MSLLPAWRGSLLSRLLYWSHPRYTVFQWSGTSSYPSVEKLPSPVEEDQKKQLCLVPDGRGQIRSCSWQGWGTTQSCRRALESSSATYLSRTIVRLKLEPGLGYSLTLFSKSPWASWALLSSPQRCQPVYIHVLQQSYSLLTLQLPRNANFNFMEKVVWGHLRCHCLHPFSLCQTLSATATLTTFSPVSRIRFPSFQLPHMWLPFPRNLLPNSLLADLLSPEPPVL